MILLLQIFRRHFINSYGEIMTIKLPGFLYYDFIIN